jgi:uncharacterized radical SAM superfamily protein
MKVLFINPNLGGVAGLNVGLAYVISSVEKKHKVRLLDLSFYSKGCLKGIAGDVAGDKPDIVAFSVTSFTYRKSLEIAGSIKDACPEIPFIFGGVHPTLLPEETIAHPLVDAVCVGEGEKPFLEYLDRMEEGRAPDDIAGIWYKDGKGRLHKNNPRPFEENVDGFVFPNWDHWKINNYLDTNLYYLPGALKFLSSRGCLYNCSFCSNKAIKEAVPGKYYRVRSVRNVVEEIKFNLSKYGNNGFKSVVFGDEIFGLDLGWLKEFRRLYKEEGLDRKLRWSCATRADIVTEEWAGTASDAGCRIVMLGIESADDYIRNGVYKKNISREQIMNATRLLRENGIEYNFSMMIGCPEDNRETVEKNIRLAKELKPAIFDISFYQPLPKTMLGSEICRSAEVSESETVEFLDYPLSFPRMHTRDLTVSDLNMVMWRVRLIKLSRFFTLGIAAKKMYFIWDLVKYIFSIGGFRKIPFRNPTICMDIQCKTIFKYALDARDKLLSTASRKTEGNLKFYESSIH